MNNTAPSPSTISGDDAAEKSHQFSAANVLLMCMIIGLCIFTSYMIKKFKCYRIPESAAAMTIGVIVGGVAKLAQPSQAEMKMLSFQPEIFFFLLLPPIIFEAGYTLNKKGFFSNFSTIALYAVVGTLISTGVVGGLSYAAAKAGWVSIDSTSPVEALLFGALISAVDPVATLSIMGNKDIAADPTLYSLIFGESVLNDAVAIVLFKTIQGFGDGQGEGATFDGEAVWIVFLQFLGVSIGSSVLGLCMGLLCSKIFRMTNLKQHPKYELTILFLFRYVAIGLCCVYVHARRSRTWGIHGGEVGERLVLRCGCASRHTAVPVRVSMRVSMRVSRHVSFVFACACLHVCFVVVGAAHTRG